MNKSISTVKYMKILGNSNCDINPLQKQLLYRTCVLPITLYGFQLWFHNQAPITYYFRKDTEKSGNMDLRDFKTSPLYSIKAIAGLIPIKLHLQKLGRRSQLQAHKLPPNHLVHSLIDSQLSTPSTHNIIPLNSITNWQRSLIKGHLVDIANRFNECFPSFSPLHSEFSPGCKIIDNFSDCFSFNVYDKEKDNKYHTHQLDEIVLESSLSSSIAIIASDASIKNNVATLISHTHMYNRLITKTIHHAVHITSTEAELFTIRCSINQTSNFDNVSKIFVVTNSIHTVRKIFELFVHPYQV